MIAFRIAKDTASPRLLTMLNRARNLTPAYAAGAAELERQIQLHLARLQARGNKMGFAPKGFFVGARDSVSNHVKITKLSNRGATVVIDDYRFAHRIKGGVVSPKRAKMLAIPLTSRAYHTPGPLRSTWPGLKLRNGFLLAGNVKQFVLVRSVRHSPKPGERPDGRTYGPKVFKAVSQSVNGMMKK